jgi:hypothetical protein
MTYCLKLSEYPNNEIRATLYQATVKPFSYDETHETEGRPPLLDIESKSETCPGAPSLKSGWGKLPRPTEFSRRGKRLLLRVGGVFTKMEFSPSDVVFLTGTLPASTSEAFQTIAAYSGFLIHGLKAWVNKYLKGKMDFYVWEHQKRGALHIHYAVYCPDSATAAKLKERFPTQWVNLLRRVSLESGVDMFDTGRGFSWTPEYAATLQYAQTVIKDVSRYLAKYVSKSAGRSSDEEGQPFYAPSQWYGISRPLLALLRQLTREEIFYFDRRREAEVAFSDISARLENVSDVWHTYLCRYSGLPTVVAYSSHYDLQNLCHLANLNPMSQAPSQQTSLKHAEWTISYLNSLMTRYSITPYSLSKNSSQTAVIAAEQCASSREPNIAGVMDLTHAIRWSLWYKFRDRNPPSTYQRDMEKADELYHKLLTLKLRLNLRGDEPLHECFADTVDRKSG